MNKSLSVLDKKISSAKNKLEVGGVYFHYKSPDQYYVIESIGFIEESEEVCVVYRALYDKGIVWVRTLENFSEEVKRGVKRFQKASPSY